MLARNPRLREGEKARWIGLLAAAVALPACSVDGGGHHGNGSQNQEPLVYFEAEPNNHWIDADFIGSVDPFSHFFIDGFVQSPGGGDIVDYFELFATEPTTLSMYLEGFAPGADLDLCVYDPELGQILACFESPFNPEVIEIVVHEPGRSFQVFVEAFTVDSEYSLEVVGSPYAWPITVDENAPAISVRPGTLELPPLEEPEGHADQKERDEAQPVASPTASLESVQN